MLTQHPSAAPTPAECCTELGAEPDATRRRPPIDWNIVSVWIVAWVAGVAMIGIPLGALVAAALATQGAAP